MTSANVELPKLSTAEIDPRRRHRPVLRARLRGHQPARHRRPGRHPGRQPVQPPRRRRRACSTRSCRRSSRTCSTSSMSGWPRSPGASIGSASASRSTSSSTRRVPREVFIGNSELRSLTPAHRKKVVKLRDQYEQRFVDIIEQGVADGSFQAPDTEAQRLGDPRRRHQPVGLVPARRPAAPRRHRLAVHGTDPQRAGHGTHGHESVNARV